MKPSLIITMLALVSGLLILGLAHKIPTVKDLDLHLIKFYGDIHKLELSNDAQLKLIVPEAAPEIILPPIERPGEELPPIAPFYRIIAITDDPHRIFETSPPSPLDYAVILDALHEQGEKSVIFATQLSWDEHSQMALNALDSRLTPFEHAYIALPVARGSMKRPIPPSLKRALIPFSKIIGKYQSLPTVNRVTLPKHPNGGERTLAGFNTIESEEPNHDDYIPMLAQWEDEGLIPSLELLTLMSAHEVSIDELTIHVGQFIQLGEDGVTIPIDRFGRVQTPLAEIEKLALHTIPAETLLETRPEQTTTNNDTASADISNPEPNNENLDVKSQKRTTVGLTPEDSTPDGIDSATTKVSIIQAIGEKTLATNSFSPERLNQLLVTASDFTKFIPIAAVEASASPLPKVTKGPILRAPPHTELAVFTAIAFFIYLITGVNSFAFHGYYLLLTLTLLAGLLFMMQNMNQWVTMPPSLAAILTAWIFNVIRYQKHAN